MDMLYVTALHADIITAATCLRTCKYLLYYYGFWKTKFMIKYPNRYYVEAWTGLENCLVQSKAMCLIGDIDTFHHWFYENDILLKKIITMQQSYGGCCKFKIYDIYLVNRYIILKRGTDLKDIMLSQHNTEADVILAIKDDYQKMLTGYNEYDDFVYAIIDAENLIPFFARIGDMLSNKIVDGNTRVKFLFGEIGYFSIPDNFFV